MKIGRLIYQKLIEPLIRSKKPPIYKARGVAVGLAWAMTPLVGIQMFLVTFTWGVLKKFKWHFSLPLALAWTWITNVATLVPVYYVFYITGQLMRGNFDDITGYDALKDLIARIFLSEEPFMKQMEAFCELLFIDWGVSMFIGCIPWVIISGFLGYHLTLKFIQKKEALIKKKRSKK